MNEQINDFLKKGNVFAVVGVSRKPAKYGHQVYKDLKEAGYAVYAVNPNIDEISGERCYHSLSELPEKPDVVDTVVPPKIPEKAIEVLLNYFSKKEINEIIPQREELNSSPLSFSCGRDTSHLKK